MHEWQSPFLKGTVQLNDYLISTIMNIMNFLYTLRHFYLHTLHQFDNPKKILINNPKNKLS